MYLYVKETRDPYYLCPMHASLQTFAKTKGKFGMKAFCCDNHRIIQNHSDDIGDGVISQ